MSANAWQKNCTKLFENIIDNPLLSQRQKADEWVKEKVMLAQRQRVILADTNLSNRDLSGFDFSFVYFARVQFVGASLVNTSFMKAIFLDCSMRGADLKGASLLLADTKTMDMAGVKNYQRANLNTITPITARNYARPYLIRLAEEHRQKFDRLEVTGRLGRFFAWTDFGARLLPTIYICTIVNVLFASAYWIIEQVFPGTFTVAGVAKGDVGPWGLLLMTLQRFTNSPPLIESSSILVGYLFVMNAIAGVIAAGIFVAQLTKRLVLSGQ